MRYNFIFLISGAIVGALSWAVCPLVSNYFEPFDSISGFTCGQVILSIAAIYAGTTSKYLTLLFGALGAHMGQNIYAYVFGSGDQRAYFLITIFTSLALLVIPLILGLMTLLFKRHSRSN